MKKILKSNKDFQDIIGKQLGDEDEGIRSHAAMINSILDSGTVAEFKDQLKKSIGEKVVPGNFFAPDLGLVQQDKKYDMVTSGKEGGVELLTCNFGIESATPERSHWETGIKNIISKVKLNGYLALTILRNASGYWVGEKKLPSTSVNEDDIREILEINGCEILECQVLTGFDKEKLGYDGTVMVFAKKSNKA